MMVTADDARAVIPKLPHMYDEPFADSSQIPTHLVCRAARAHVTVALSGDGGDELFGGYNRYFWGPSVWNRVAWLPYPVRAALGSAVSAVPHHAWDSVGRAYNGVRPGGAGIQRLGDKAHKLASRLRRVRSMDELYLSLVSEWQDPAATLVRADGRSLREPASLLADALPARGMEAVQARMMYWDSITYLPDDILCKVDRAAMSVSLETRVPLLDHRVAELAWRLPLSMKVRGAGGKWALRQVLFRHVPPALIERPKAGFGVPIVDWLRGPLREWAEALLDERRLEREGYLNPAPIRQAWLEHLGGTRDWTHRIWSVLMFQAWLEENA
jgi:asparagine synthase (glutamine-hydrolysing)